MPPLLPLLLLDLQLQIPLQVLKVLREPNIGKHFASVDGIRSKSPASFRIAVKGLEDPAVQCGWLAVSG
jgi:hypothetical protein